MGSEAFCVSQVQGGLSAVTNLKCVQLYRFFYQMQVDFSRTWLPGRLSLFNSLFSSRELAKGQYIAALLLAN